MGNSQEPQDFNISVMPSSLTPVHVAKAAEGLNLYDTASHQVSHFVPLKPGEVGIYVCGATVQSSPHIGHIRAAVAFDIVRRWFLKLGYKVTFVRNVTDIDDKILVKAAAAGQRWWARAYYYEREFTEAYNTLGVLPPTVEPRATGHMSDMIDLIQRILDNGHGYVVTDADGKPTDADLLSGCTIAVDRYRDAVVRACENAQVLGAARGDTVKLGVEVAEMPQGLVGTDDKDAQVQAKITLAVVTMDENARVTSAIGDMTEPELTVSADGTVSAPREPVYTKNELGDRYGMRSASALGKEWYEHSAGWCGYLKGKNAVEIGKLSADGTDADLKALCTISVTDLQKAVLKAMAEQ